MSEITSHLPSHMKKNKTATEEHEEFVSPSTQMMMMMKQMKMKSIYNTITIQNIVQDRKSVV